MIQRDTCDPLLTAALFKVARYGSIVSCSSVSEWIKKTPHVHPWNITQPQKERNPHICNNMDGNRGYYTK